MTDSLRPLPVPSSISELAQTQLATMMGLDLAGAEEPKDTAGWAALATFADEMLLTMLPGPSASTVVTPGELGGVATFDVEPSGAASDLTCLYLHGGAFTMGAGPVCAAMTASFAEGVSVRSVGVDYRMPPHHPYPAPLDDCTAAYRSLLETHDPAQVVVVGMSAGGNLAAALIIRCRMEGLAMPGALVLLSPEVDLTESGDSFQTNLGADPVLRSSLSPSIAIYADGHDLSDPLLSPLFGEITEDHPPTFLQCGTRDLFLSNTVRFHRTLRRHSIDAELHVFEAMPHGGFGGMLEGGFGAAPEDREVYEELRRFLARQLGEAAS